MMETLETEFELVMPEKIFLQAVGIASIVFVFSFALWDSLGVLVLALKTSCLEFCGLCARASQKSNFFTS